MVKTVLYAEKLYDNDKVEREVFGAGRPRGVAQRRQPVAARGPRLRRGRRPDGDAACGDRRVPRQVPQARLRRAHGRGLRQIDRTAAAARQVMVCNVPDYGTTEVADHALALALSLRRGIALPPRGTAAAAARAVELPARLAAPAQRRADLRHRRFGPHPARRRRSGQRLSSSASSPTTRTCRTAPNLASASSASARSRR